VDEGAQVPDGESEEPQNEKNDEDGPQHDLSPFSVVEKGKACASLGRNPEAGPMSGTALKNPSELPARLDLAQARGLLLVDVPAPLGDLLRASRGEGEEPVLVEARSLASIKQAFDAVLLWREDRVGSRAVLEKAVKRLEPQGILWVVIAMKKVRGPRTPAAHRLELPDLAKGLDPHGLVNDREVRITAWHAAYRFVKRKT